MTNRHSGNNDTHGQPRRTALFIDFDNIYISLVSRNKTAATRFATNPAAWTAALLDGSLSTTSVQSKGHPPARRKLIARVYGNPVLKNKDRSSFAYIRTHFMQAGYEIIDCPPLTNQLKNGSDIKMVLDMRDLLEHDPRVDEFIIMSGDSDFAPLLLRLRAHDRRTMIYGGLQTSKSYTALADEIITEESLVSFLESFHMSAPLTASQSKTQPVKSLDPIDEARLEIVEEVSKIVEHSPAPVSMELLATSVRNRLGLKRTIDTKWAGHGQFSLLLAQALSREFTVSDHPPYMVWHKKIHDDPKSDQNIEPVPITKKRASQEPLMDESLSELDNHISHESALVEASGSSVKAVIDNILQITHIPALSASYYQRLFQFISEEIRENGFVFKTTAEQTAQRGRDVKLPVHPDHVQAILHRVRRHGHWFSDKDDASVLAQVFRDSVIAECLEDGLKLTDRQLEMIDGWFLPPDDAIKDKPVEQENQSIEDALAVNS